MELFNYLLKVSACSALFFAFYLLVLRRLTFFKFNRFYLLGSLLVSFIIPALQFTIEREMAAPGEPKIANSPLVINDELLNSSITVNSIQAEGTGDFNWVDLLPIFYALVAFGLLLIAIVRLAKLLKHTRTPFEKVNGLKLVVKNGGFTNCSFFNYVFVKEGSLSAEELAILLQHEKVHAKQFHSIDKLLLTVVKAILWFNPIVFLYDKELEQIHEYEADEATSRTVGRETYANLLLNLAVCKRTNPLLHNFVKSPIKQRIKMLFNSKSKNMKKLAYLLALPIGLGLIWGFTVEIVYAKPMEIASAVFSTDNFPALVIPKSGIAAAKEQIASLPVKQIMKTSEDTLRLVGSSKLGKNPIVIIDGKSYDAKILTKISPKSVRSTLTTPNQITITTKNNKIEYATKNEIYNFGVLHRLDNSKLYLKYKLRKESGEVYEVVKVNNINGSASRDVPRNSKVVVLIGDKEYTEARANEMGRATVTYGINIIHREMPEFAQNFPQYVGKYDVVVIVPEKGSEASRLKTKLSITDNKIIMVLTNRTNLEEIMDFKKQLKEKNIDLEVLKITYTDDKKIKALKIGVNCNDGFSGTYEADLAIGEAIGFYRNYEAGASSPFGMSPFSTTETNNAIGLKN